MKFLKRTLIIIFLITIFGFIFRNWLYLHLFNYKYIGERHMYSVSNKEFIDYINNELKNQEIPKDTKAIIHLSLELTSKKLSFHEEHSDIDPNKLIHSKSTHCIGYSAFFSATCNYLLAKYGYDQWCFSKPFNGQIYFCGINIHNYIDSPFFKDHDFNVIVNKKTNEQYFVDPTLYDYTGIDYISSK